MSIYQSIPLWYEREQTAVPCSRPLDASIPSQNQSRHHLAHDSVVTFALAFVTLTPNCFAFARISTRFRDDTACEILLGEGPVSFKSHISGAACAASRPGRFHVLCGESPVVHKEQVNVPRVVDEECLVARGHHVAGLLVRAVSDLDAFASAVSSTPLHPGDSICAPLPCLVRLFSSVSGAGCRLPGVEGRTLGIGALPLNRLLTALSIPLGLRQFGFTHLKRSL